MVLSLSCKEYLTKPKVSPASSESRDDCGDAETLLGFLFLIPFPYNHLSPSVCKFLRRAIVAVESCGQAASVRDTERTLAIMLRRAERAIRMFHNRAGAASLYEHWLYRLDGHQSATSNDSRDPAKRNDDDLIPFRNFSAFLGCFLPPAAKAGVFDSRFSTLNPCGAVYSARLGRSPSGKKQFLKQDT